MRTNMNIVTNEHFYLSDGGKIHFRYDEEIGGCGLCGGFYSDEYKGRNSEDIEKFIIPDKINGKPVIEIDGDTFDGMSRLSGFAVDVDNQYFTIYEGGLYSKDMKKMIHLPPKYCEKLFCVPDTVEYIMDSALSNSYIETMILSPGCTKIYEYGISVAKALKRIYIPKSIEFVGFKAFLGTAPEEVFYEGSMEDRKAINFTDEGFNAGLINAKWHYYCDLSVKDELERAYQIGQKGGEDALNK